MTEPLRTLGSYDLETPLGVGVAGRLFRARDRRDRRECVVCVLDPKSFSTPDNAASVVREAAILAGLRHPNVVGVLETHLDEPPLYIAFEKAPGGLLRDVLRRRRLHFAEAVRVFRDVCRGLEAAHLAGLIHRELSPATVAVSDDLSTIKLTELRLGGINYLKLHEGETQTASFDVSMFAYYAPEMVQGQDPDQRSDIYAAGVLIYEMLTGVKPTGRFSLPSQLNSEVPPEFDAIVLRALSTDPNRRQPNAQVLLAELRSLEERLRLGLAHNLGGITRRIPTAKRPMARVGLIAGAALVGLAAMAMVLFLVFGRQFSQESSSRESGREADASTPESGADAGPSGDDQPVAGTTPGPTDTDTATGTAATEALTNVATTTAADRSSEPPATEQAARRPQASRSETSSARRAAAEPAAVEAAPETTASDETEARQQEARQIEQDLAVIERKITNSLYDTALADVEALLQRHGQDEGVRLRALVLQAAAHAGMKQIERLRATEIEAEMRFAEHAALPEALFAMAKIELSTTDSGRHTAALRLLRKAIAAEPAAAWVAGALMLQAQTEIAVGEMVTDNTRGTRVPAALATLHRLITEHPRAGETPQALAQLGQLSEEAKYHLQAGQAYYELARRTRDAETAWKAAQLLEKAEAPTSTIIAAYELIAADSERHRGAQRRIENLRKK